METTRHFVATCYVVNDGATLLHEHEKLEMWLPPGGHVDRDELPHETALRETLDTSSRLRGVFACRAAAYSDAVETPSMDRPGSRSSSSARR